jgi:hypothetical protein
MPNNEANEAQTNASLVATMVAANGGTLASNLAAAGFKVTGLGAGSEAGDSARYEQVMLLAGGTMTGLLIAALGGLKIPAGDVASGVIGQLKVVGTVLYMCTIAGTPGTWVAVGDLATLWAPIASPTFTGVATLAVGGIVLPEGNVASGVVGQLKMVSGVVYKCTVAGTPGTWVALGVARLEKLCSRVNAGVAVAAAATKYLPLAGVLTAETTEANASVALHAGGVAKNLRVTALANTLSGNAVLTFRDDAAGTTLTVTIASGSTTAVADVTHAPVVVADSLVDVAIVCDAGTGSITIGSVECDVEVA